MAQGNKKPIPSDSDNNSDSDDDLPYDKIVQKNLNFAKVCTSQQKKLEKLKKN